MPGRHVQPDFLPFFKRGQFGDGIDISSAVPVQVSGLTDVTAVAAGYQYSMALKADGTVACWGCIGDDVRADYGQCDAPSDFFVQVSVDNFHSCGVREDVCARVGDHEIEVEALQDYLTAVTGEVWQEVEEAVASRLMDQFLDQEVVAAAVRRAPSALGSWPAGARRETGRSSRW